MSLRLVRRTRSQQWYIRGTVRGIRVFQTSGTNDFKVADAVRIKLESELLHRSVFGAAATVTFAEAALSYLQDGAGEARFLGHYDKKTEQWTLLIGYFGDIPIAKIGQAEIDEAANKLHPTSKAATRKRQVYIPMSAVLHHAARKGWCTVPMFQHPRVKQPTTKWSTPERLAQLLPHCSPKLRRLIVFLTYTGARISEALRVDWVADVALDRRAVILRRTKNGKPRTVHLPDPLLAELALVPEAERAGKLFAWNARKAVYGPLQRACVRAGVEYLPPHQQGRHTYATWLRAYAGVDLIGLKEAGGWDSLSSVERYAHVVPNEAAKAADRLPVVQSVCTPPDKAKKP